MQIEIGNNSALKKEIRRSMADEAKSWGLGTKEDKKYYQIWTNGTYSVELGKPGKEYFERKRNGEQKNINDMKPSVFKNGSPVVVKESFQDICLDIADLVWENPEKFPLKDLGRLLIRNAYVCDHEKINGSWRYRPPMNIVKSIEKEIPKICGLDIECFLHYMEAIFWQEDTKYHTKSIHEDWDKWASTGRPNTAMTYVHFISVFFKQEGIDRYSAMIKWAMGMQRGTSQITQKLAKEIFDLT